MRRHRWWAVVLLCGGTLRSSPVPAQAPPAPPVAGTLAQVVTVGTRSSGRTVRDATAPVTVLTAEQLRATGLPETWQQLQALVPGINVPHIPVGDNSMRPVTLHGLAPHHVLVLVNGRRLHPAATLLSGPSVPFTAFTDIASIPAAAIERIEVLGNGAAAQYGSDAISGVVNIVLKSGTQRELVATAGQVASAEGGRTWHDGTTVGVSGTYGLVTPRQRVALSGEWRARDATNRAYPDARPQYFAGDARNGAAPRITSHIGDGAATTMLAMVSAGRSLGVHHELYLTGGLSRRDAAADDFRFRRAADDVTVRALHPDGFLPRIGSLVDDGSLAIGARGSAAAWRWDVAAGVGGNRVAYDVGNSNNASLGAASPVSFDAGAVSATQWTANVDVSHALAVAQVPVTLSAGAELRLEQYRIRPGDDASWINGGVRIIDGPSNGLPAETGSQGFTGFRPVDATRADRRVAAVYVESEFRPVQRLIVQAAARHERYDDVGATTTGTLAGRMQLAHAVALRAQLGSGFRAPSLSQLGFASTGTEFSDGPGGLTTLTSRTLPVSTIEAQLMGATPLTPERSVQCSAGILLELPHLPTLTADVFQLDIDDRIDLGGTIIDTSLTRRFIEAGLRGVDGGNYFRNAFDTRTRGIDVAALATVTLAPHAHVALSALYTLAQHRVRRVHAPPAPLARFADDLFNRGTRAVVEEGQPPSVLALHAELLVHHFSVAVHEQRAASTAQRFGSERLDQVLQPRWITDAHVAYRLRPSVAVTLTVRNLLDRYPTEWRLFKSGVAAPGPSLFGTSRYPGGLSPFGMNGRTVYLQLSVR